MRKKDKLKITYSTNNKLLSINYDDESVIGMNQKTGDVYVDNKLIGKSKEVIKFFKDNLLSAD